VDSPRHPTLSGKRLFRPTVMASLSKWKQTVAVLLGEFPAMVKSRTRAVRHGEAPRLVAWA
jgi:hypothetical protein